MCGGARCLRGISSDPAASLLIEIPDEPAEIGCAAPTPRTLLCITVRRADFGIVLDSPGSYRLAQTWLAPGAAADLCGRLRHWLDDAQPHGWALDVGCGPAALLAQAGYRRVIGVDTSWERAAAVQRTGGVVVTATAAALPFADGEFDIVWSGGLLHHLRDDEARTAIGEILRVTRAGGRTAIFDSVRPEPAWRRPLAWAVRRLDRGRYVRTQAALEALLPERQAWICERFTYTRNGLEGLWCAYRKSLMAGAARAMAQR